MRMLESEGFAWERYVDIFDGGPTMTARTDRSETVRDAPDRQGGGRRSRWRGRLVATGKLQQFRVTQGRVAETRGRCRDRPADSRAARHRRRRRNHARGALMPDRGQLRRDHRPEPQLCRAEPRQSRGDARRRARLSRPRAAALQESQDARQHPRSGSPRAFLLPHARPDRRWLASLGAHYEDAPPHTQAQALSASPMWAANAATVSPAPDTADGNCHLSVANLGDHAPSAAMNGPETLAQLRLAFADPAFAVHGPVPRAIRRRGRGQLPCGFAAAPRRAGRRSVRLMASRAAPSPRASIPMRARRWRGGIGSSARAVRPAIRGSDRGRRVPQRRGRSRRTAACCSRTNRPSPPRIAFHADLRAMLPKSRSSRCPPRR